MANDRVRRGAVVAAGSKWPQPWRELSVRSLGDVFDQDVVVPSRAVDPVDKQRPTVP
jgi:hypothetical protein